MFQMMKLSMTMVRWHYSFFLLQNESVIAVVMWPEVLGDLYGKPASTLLLDLTDNLHRGLLVQVPTSDSHLEWLSYKKLHMMSFKLL